MPGMEDAHALVIGIADYLNTNQYLGKLPPTVCKDARDVHALLIDPGRGGYLPENARLLLDGEATLAGLRDALAGLAARCEAESAVMLYVSSHGGYISEGEAAGEYILPVDVIYTSEGLLRPETALSGAEFSAALSLIPARKVMVIFDCCHAGGIGEIKGGAAPEMKAGLPERYYESLQAGRGRVIIASSRSSESSWLMPGDENSLFTKHLLSGLAGGAASPDGFVRVFDIFEYVQPRVTGQQPQQHPIFQSKMEENFPIALSLGGQKGSALQDAEGYRFDAYITFANVEPDAGWVWGTLAPRLRAAGLRIAVSGEAEDPGVALVLGIERAIEQSKRTVAVISRAYLTGEWNAFENVMALTLGVTESKARLLPLVLEPDLLGPDGRSLGPAAPLRLRQATCINMQAQWIDPFKRLIDAVRSPLPGLSGR
jgi:hypothetical protein